MTENIERNKENQVPESNTKISQLDAQIATLEARKTTLEESKTNNQEDEDFHTQISEIVTKLEKLKAEREKLIQETQQNIKDIPLSQAQQAQAIDAINKAGLDGDQKRKVEESIKSGNLNFLDTVSGEGGIFAIILSIFQNLFNYNSPDTQDDEFSVVPVKITEKEKLDFVKEAKVYALEVEQKYGIPWEVSLSQCILESGWGTSKSARKDGVYFGIKGKGVAYKTQEDYGNGLVNITDEFKTYKNMREAFLGYGEFLTKNPRYKPAFNYASQMIFGLSTNYQGRDPVSFIKEVKNAGYATDSNYVGKIVSIQKGLEKIA